MNKSELDVTDESKRLCRQLLDSEQRVPNGTLFDDDMFDRGCGTCRARTKPKVI